MDELVDLKDGMNKKFLRNSKKKLEVFTWEFGVEVAGEYELRFFVRTGNRFETLFKAVRNTMKEKHEHILKNDVSVLDSDVLDIPVKFHKLLKVLIGPFFKDRREYLENRVKAPVLLLNFKLDKAFFRRVKGDWEIVVFVSGTFKDVRR